MRSKFAVPSIATAVAVAALAIPAASQAKHGADDPAGHVSHEPSVTHHQRHSGADDGLRARRAGDDHAHRGARHHRRHHRHAEHGDDHGRRHGGRGTDD